MSIQSANLNAIPTKFTDVLNTINNYGTDDVFEALCKAELANMTKEFQSLLVDVNSAVTDLAERKEF